MIGKIRKLVEERNKLRNEIINKTGKERESAILKMTNNALIKQLEVRKQMLRDFNESKIINRKALEVEQDEKSLKKIQKAIESEDRFIDELRKQIIKSIMTSQELFEMEEEDGSSVTEESLNKKETDELMEIMDSIILELTRIQEE